MEYTDSTYPAMEPRKHLAVYVEQICRKTKADGGSQRHKVDDYHATSPFLCLRPRIGSKPETNDVPG
ncbi:uncharacterized protein N7529_003281 [Penicillium soppii]|jgi:hypothetical protein|uniref:uncharacterized protein n=1 Tax=Penicillium soppii TaxID=69789 RepID=UPI002548F2E6|nr:uncharacterized protein N7529_003281 [Penicillium soppii]KAJ5874851.1 hypothetical protein N7529_003281 [Penicillium soppii]